MGKATYFGWCGRGLLSAAASVSLAFTAPLFAQTPGGGEAGAVVAAQPASPAPAPVIQGSKFSLTIDPAVQSSPYSGRVYVVLSRRERPEPRRSMGSWYNSPTVIAKDLRDVKPGEAFEIGPGTLTFPATQYENIREGTYYAQAVARVNLDCPEPGKGDGDLYSEVIKVDFSPVASGGEAVALRLSKRVEKPALADRGRVRFVEMVSPALSKFYGREVKSRAGVLLPEDWQDDAGKNYPTVYFCTGFNDDHTFVNALQGMVQRHPNAGGMIFVVPDASCGLGNSVFADSANNGPRGEALIKELIPEIEKRFHGAGSGTRRFVTGISSGGWASLWLQVEYPDDFNGCWSHCPDPVDFRDFQQIDLYAPGANMYTDEKGGRRPLARGMSGEATLWYEDFVRQETVMGDGGQIHSFEAVFSPRGSDGAPVPLFERATGNVNTAAAKAWEKFDLRLKMEREWESKKDKLAGKIHVFAGERDTFYLNGAAAKLKDALAKLGSDAEVMIVPDMPHTIYPTGVRTMLAEIREKCGMELIEKQAPKAKEEDAVGAGAK